jgi:hypothetical protein
MFSRQNNTYQQALSPGSQAPNGTNPEQRFTLLHLKQLYQQLVDNKVVTPSNEDLVVEILYTIAEMVVYGDNKSELLFDFFCEKNMLSLFLELMWAPQQVIDKPSLCPNKVHIQILQTLSILINSVRNDTSLYYLLSNNYINEIIVFPHIFENDESLRDQFVSFLKTLSIRLNPKTVQFFFVEETGAFPLLSRAIDILKFKDPMVRIACQTVILNIFQVPDSRARKYALDGEMMYKFLNEIIIIMEKYFNDIIKDCLDYQKSIDTPNNQKTLDRLENAITDISASLEDWMYFLQEVLGLGILKLRQAVVYYILSQYVYPTLLPTFQTIARKKMNYEAFSIKRFISSSASSAESSPMSKVALSMDHSDTTHDIGVDSDAFLNEKMGNGEDRPSLPLDRYTVKEMNGIIRNSTIDSSSKTSKSSKLRLSPSRSFVSSSDDTSENQHDVSDAESLIRASVALHILATVS